MTAEQETLETWGDKAKRLSDELKALRYKDPTKTTPKQRKAYSAKRYELLRHLELAL